GVAVHQVRPLAGDGVGHREVDPERPQRGVGAPQGLRHRVAGGPRLGHRLVEGPDPDLQVAPGPQRPDQLGHVHAGTAVDVGWVLPGEDVDAHVTTLAGRVDLSLRNASGPRL